MLKASSYSFPVSLILQSGEKRDLRVFIKELRIVSQLYEKRQKKEKKEKRESAYCASGSGCLLISSASVSDIEPALCACVIYRRASVETLREPSTDYMAVAL